MSASRCTKARSNTFNLIAIARLRPRVLLARRSAEHLRERRKRRHQTAAPITDSGAVAGVRSAAAAYDLPGRPGVAVPATATSSAQLDALYEVTGAP